MKDHLALIWHDRNRTAEAKQLLLSCGDQPRFAPFYATRAAIFNDSTVDFIFSDLNKAFRLDSTWRYRKLLTEFYIDRKNAGAALQLIQPYMKQHPDDYIMGMLYARALLLDGQYAAADHLLTHLTIIPFEGATLSHELYRQAKLIEGIAAFKNKQYSKSINFIQQAKQWPENLGVGEPYPENIDERLENWIIYSNYKAMHEQDKANAMLDSIITNSKNVMNADKYFTNSIITAWTFKQLKKDENGIQWLQHESNNYPDKNIAAWILKPGIDNLPTSLNDRESTNAFIIRNLNNY